MLQLLRVLKLRSQTSADNQAAALGRRMTAAKLSVDPAALPSSQPATSSPPPSPRLNVLMILIDDLRPALGCYGDALAISPHIDALANESVRFNAAYASVATCSPSRTSLLTGLRPDTHRVYDLETHFRDSAPRGTTTLPQLFRNAGYLSLSYGKVFHENLDDAPSWSSQSEFDDGEINRGTNTTYGRDWWYMEYDSEAHATPYKGHRFGLAWERSKRANELHVDHAIATRATRTLRRLAGGAREAAQGGVAARPFFLAVGFVRPHLPFSAPEAAWRRHEKPGAATTRFVVPPLEPPRGVSEQSRKALGKWGELRAYSEVPPKPPLQPPEKAARAIHGYYAGVTWVDEQVGRVIDAARAEPLLWQRTVVALMSDHGWKLGEHGAWSKHTTFEADTRVPLLVRLPDAAAVAAAATAANAAGGSSAAAARPARGVVARGIVELIDVMPTLAEVAGLGAATAAALRPRLEGVSFASALRAGPAGEAARGVSGGKPHALSQWLAHTGKRDVLPCMAYAVRTRTHAAHVWVAANTTVEAAARCKASRDVYALARPGDRETANIADAPEGAAVLLRLKSYLEEQRGRWRPPPEEGTAAAINPVKVHYVAWPNASAAVTAAAATADRRPSYAVTSPPRLRHTCAALACTKQRCFERERLAGAWRDGAP